MRIITIVPMLLLVFLSACNTAYYASHPVQHLNLVKAPNKIERIKNKPQAIDTLALLPVKHVGVSMPSYTETLRHLQGNFTALSHIQNHHSIVTRLIERRLIKKLKSQSPNLTNDGTEGTSNSALIVIGILLLIAGALLLWYVSILFGGLIGTLGLILLIVGLASNPNNNRNQYNNSPQQQQIQQPVQKQYQDVVYLKNGSIIRGMIIEQIPNTSLKIQTVDGSVFVYQMSDVEKMTKELSK